MGPIVSHVPQHFCNALVFCVAFVATRMHTCGMYAIIRSVNVTRFMELNDAPCCYSGYYNLGVQLNLFFFSYERNKTWGGVILYTSMK